MSNGAVPPASREELPTEVGGATTAKPQTSCGAGGQTLERQMATKASGAMASWEESDGDGSSSWDGNDAALRKDT